MGCVPFFKSILLSEKVRQQFSRVLLLLYSVFLMNFHFEKARISPTVAFFCRIPLNPSPKPVKSRSNFGDSYLHLMVAIVFILDLSLTVLKIGLYYIFAS